MYNFDLLPERRSTDSIKWRAYPEDVLPLWVADMDFLSPPAVIEALHRRVDHGVFGYPVSVSGEGAQMPELNEVLVAHLKEKYGWQVQPEAILLVPGIVTGLDLACHALAAPGEGVLVQPPVYPPFLGAPQEAGAVRQEAELIHFPDGTYGVDQAAFEAAITAETRLFILCNPHNPVGRVFTRRELEGMADACLRRGVTICSDEIHCDLVYTGHQHIPLASLDPEIAQHSITLMAPSKTYNLAGLEFSFAVIPNPELLKRYTAARKGLVGWINVMGLVAAQAAYLHGQPWLDAMLAYLEANRDFLECTVQRDLPGVRMASPEGTYLAWLDCREANLPCDPYDFFLEKARGA